MIFPAGFQPGDKLVKKVEQNGDVTSWTWERGSSPTPTPEAPTDVPELRLVSLGYQSQMPARPMFPPAVPDWNLVKGQALWRRPVTSLSVHQKSGVWLNTIGSSSRVHPDFSSSSYGAGIPINLHRGAERLYHVEVLYKDESDLSPGGYPIPQGAYVENGEDKHLIVVDPDLWAAWEFYGFNRQIDPATGKYAYTAEQATFWDLGKDAARTRGWTSADASGCSILAGLVRYEEVFAGAIYHALRFTAQPTDHAFVPPASHFAAPANANAPPMGARLRLKQTIPLTQLPSGKAISLRVAVILQAMRTYGLILADNGTTGYVTGCPDDRWNDDELAQLGEYIIGRDFEFVDTGATPIAQV